jgi:AraC-like DNA-binding protein
MKRAGGLEEFARAPAGSFLAGPSWLIFCDAIWGVMLFGRPDRDAAAEMARAFSVELEQPPHVTLVDASALEGIDAGAFELLQEFARSNLERSRDKVQRLALVLPRGVSGAVVAGFYGVLGPPCPIHTAEDRAEALRWLSAELPWLDATLAEARGTPPLLGTLRAILRQDPAHPTVEAAADRLGLSVRTLQRRLAEADTSFARLVLEARIDEAKRRLAESDDAVTVIALELGFGSSQHFSRQFRQATRATPSEWRARHRTAPPSAGSS